MNSSIASWFTIRCVHWPLWLNKAIERSICDGRNGGWMKHHRLHDIWSPCDYFMTATCGLHNKKWWKIIFLTFINNELHNWSFYNFFVTNTVIPMFPYHKTTRVSDVIRKQQARGSNLTHISENWNKSIQIFVIRRLIEQFYSILFVIKKASKRQNNNRRWRRKIDYADLSDCWLIGGHLRGWLNTEKYSSNDLGNLIVADAADL